MSIFDWIIGKNKVTNESSGKNKVADGSSDWKKLLKRLSASQRWLEMEELSKAIISIGNKEAVPELVTLMIQSYEIGFELNEKLKDISMDTSSLLGTNVRYDSLPSSIKEQREVMGLSFRRGQYALDALVGLRAIEEFKALLRNPTYKRSWHNYQFALNRIQEEDKVGSDLNTSTSESTDENTHIKQQSTPSSTSESDKDREVTFVISCGICGYNTDVTVRIDWGGGILSGSGTDHEFRCNNCKKIFTVSKESLKQYTDHFV